MKNRLRSNEPPITWMRPLASGTTTACERARGMTVPAVHCALAGAATSSASMARKEARTVLWIKTFRL
jgi:hypothetical protein